MRYALPIAAGTAKLADSQAVKQQAEQKTRAAAALIEEMPLFQGEGCGRRKNRAFGADRACAGNAAARRVAGGRAMPRTSHNSDDNLLEVAPHLYHASCLHLAQPPFSQRLDSCLFVCLNWTLKARLLHVLQQRGYHNTPITSYQQAVPQHTRENQHRLPAARYCTNKKLWDRHQEFGGGTKRWQGRWEDMVLLNKPRPSRSILHNNTLQIRNLP
jgi:hypothetical protein